MPEIWKDNVPDSSPTQREAKEKRLGLSDPPKSIQMTNYVATMPPEILVIIFALVSNRNGDEISKPPWQVAQTCRSWRAIALGDPSLWRYIDIKVGWVKMEDTKLHALMTRTQELLKLSYNQPIDISFRWDATHTSPHSMLSLLFSHSDRWEDVSLASLHHPLDLVKVRHRLPLLKSLSLLCASQSGPLPTDLIELAPRLERLSLYAAVPEDFDLPWPQMKYFKSPGCPHAIVTKLLNRSPSLEHLEYMHFDAIPPASVHIRTHTALTHLIICFGFSPWDRSENLLHHLCLPQLHVLKITSPSDTQSIVTSVVSMLEKSSRIRGSGSDYSKQKSTSALSYHPLQSISLPFCQDLGEDSGIEHLSRLTPDLHHLCVPMATKHQFSHLINVGGTTPQALTSLKSVETQVGRSLTPLIRSTFRQFILDRTASNPLPNLPDETAVHTDRDRATDQKWHPHLQSVKLTFVRTFRENLRELSRYCRENTEILECFMNPSHYSDLWTIEINDEKPVLRTHQPGIEEMRTWTSQLVDHAKAIGAEQQKDRTANPTWNILFPNAWNMRKARLRNKFENWFAELEEYARSLRDVRYLYVGGSFSHYLLCWHHLKYFHSPPQLVPMYTTLHHLSRLETPDGLDHMRHYYWKTWFEEQQFKVRALDLVDKWTIMLLDDLPNRRWKPMNSTLEYVIPGSITQDGMWLHGYPILY